MFKMEVKTGGSAFRDPFTGEESQTNEALELARILRIVERQLLAGNTDGYVMDTNGNKVCRWSR